TLVVGHVLLLHRDDRGCHWKRRPELVIDLMLDLWRCLVRADPPVCQPPLVIEGNHLAAFGGGVDVERSGDALDIIRRPGRCIDAGLALFRAGAEWAEGARGEHSREGRKGEELAPADGPRAR